MSKFSKQKTIQLEKFTEHFKGKSEIDYIELKGAHKGYFCVYEINKPCFCVFSEKGEFLSQYRCSYNIQRIQHYNRERVLLVGSKQLSIQDLKYAIDSPDPEVSAVGRKTEETILSSTVLHDGKIAVFTSDSKHRLYGSNLNPWFESQGELHEDCLFYKENLDGIVYNFNISSDEKRSFFTRWNTNWNKLEPRIEFDSLLKVVRSRSIAYGYFFLGSSSCDSNSSLISIRCFDPFTLKMVKDEPLTLFLGYNGASDMTWDSWKDQCVVIYTRQGDFFLVHWKKGVLCYCRMGANKIMNVFGGEDNIRACFLDPSSGELKVYD